MLFCTGLGKDKAISMAQSQNIDLESLFDIRPRALY